MNIFRTVKFPYYPLDPGIQSCTCAASLTQEAKRAGGRQQLAHRVRAEGALRVSKNVNYKTARGFLVLYFAFLLTGALAAQRPTNPMRI